MATDNPVTVSETVQLIRDSASCAVYPVVKRPDERVITMAAYDLTWAKLVHMVAVDLGEGLGEVVR
jgi:hypothetical protein